MYLFQPFANDLKTRSSHVVSIQTAPDTIDDFSFIFITLWLFMPKGIVVACVCPSVARLPKHASWEQVLKMGVIDLQDHLGHFDL